MALFFWLIVGRFFCILVVVECGVACRRLLQYLVMGASSVSTSQGVRREN